MFSKKTIQVVALVLLVGAALVVGASQLIGRQVIAEQSPKGPQGSGPGRATIPTASDLPAASGTVVFTENFTQPDNLSPQGWRQLPDPSDASSTWRVKDGYLQQWGDEDIRPAKNTTVLVADQTTFGDGIYEAQVFPMSGEPVGIVFRGSDAGYYRLSLKPNLPNNAPKAKLEKVAADGTVTSLAANTTWAGFALAQWQRIEVRAIGSHITASVGSAQLFDFNDSGSNLSSGWVGVWTIADRGSAFDNVRVQRVAAGQY